MSPQFPQVERRVLLSSLAMLPLLSASLRSTSALAQARYNKTRAAKLLGLTRAQLYSRIEKYGLEEREH